MERNSEKDRMTPDFLSEKEFAAAIKNKLEAYYGNKCKVSVQEVLMNNSVRNYNLNLSSEDAKMSHSICLDTLFDNYTGGEDITEICWGIIDLCEHDQGRYETDPRIGEVFNRLLCFEMIKDRICYKLINADMNSIMLKSHPHRFFLDLAVVYFISIPTEWMNADQLSIAITDKHLTLWGVDEEILYKLAEKNTVSLLGTKACLVKDFLEECLGSKFISSFDKIPELWMVSNSTRVSGAAVMLDKKLMAQMAEEIGSDYYILPSSIHEILLHAVSDNDKSNDMGQAVRDVNMSVVGREEILSNHAYRYYRHTGRIEIVG